MIKSFELHASYFLVPLFLIAAWKVTDLFRRKPEGMSFGVVRGFAFAFFLLLAVLVTYIDGITYPDTPTVLMPVFFLSVTAFYVDFFGVFIALEAAVFGVVVVLNIFLRGLSSLPESCCLCLMAMTAAIYSYWVILCEHTNSAYDKRVLKDEGSRDLLTGLLNKVSFEREVQNYLAARSGEGQGVLMIIDFDNFKRVNDNFGHLTGDEILKKFGEILKKNFRVTDIVGRIGGDEFKWGYLFISPFFLAFFVFFFIPLISTIFYSFYEYYTVGLMEVGPNFIGLDNFISLLQTDLPKYFLNTMILWLGGFLPQIALALLLASWFTDARLVIHGGKFFRAVLYMPGMIMGLDTDTYEAARIDGCSHRKAFFKIVMPALSPVISYIIITSLVSGIQMFDLPQILTDGQGSPNRSTMTLIMYLNRHLLGNNYGLAGALSVYLFLVCGILSFFIYRILNRKDDY